ncbi:hypothetical protein O0L34_g203 [Tuta absoluta]|nr:hypothetical protein O0L34_g203 [Tuta absoluta]
MKYLRIFLLVQSFFRPGYAGIISKRSLEFGSAFNGGDDITIYCTEDDHTNDPFTPPNVTLSSTDEIVVAHCLSINTTYVSVFKALDMNTSIIESLQLMFKIKEPLPPGNYTEGLLIKYLSIHNDERFENIFNNTPHFFEELSDLKSMYIGGIQIPPLPMAMELENFTLADGASITDWGNCEHLERFELTHFKKTSFPKWPLNCSKLKRFEIIYTLPDIALMVTDKMIAAAPSIHTLKITNCRLYKLPIEMINAAKNLVHLDLFNNMLYDDSFSSFPYHPTLKKLILSSNNIRGYGMGSLLKKLPALVALEMWEKESMTDCTSNFNPKTDLKRNFIEPLQNSTVDILSLGPTQLPLDCFTAIQFINLKRLTFLSMYTNPQQRKLKNLTRRIFRRTVLVEYVPSCDCQHGWLARALRDFPEIISMPTLLCEFNGIPILEVPKELLECDLTDNRYIDGCVYRKAWSDGQVKAECNLEAWNNIMNLRPLHSLNVSGQAVSTLHANLPDTLQLLDLRHNLIARGNLEETTALFSNGRRVWLDDNLLLCECDNRVFLDTLQRFRNQVQDYDQLQCVGTGEKLSSISTSVLCQLALIVTLSVCGVLMVLAVVIVVLLRRYGEQVQMFLYSRGWCISCLQKRDLDDKPYDAFISFAHEDQEYVMSTLLPGLEDAPEQFRVCVHYRDWHVGDWIPAQIMRSVQLSKRTLIVLSRSFVASTWSTLELRYALANAAKEPNAKVLVLIRDDVLNMTLDVELNKYITYNTYLRCDDPWFWEKLRYAMPHRSKNKTCGYSNRSRFGVEDVVINDITERRADT